MKKIMIISFLFLMSCVSNQKNPGNRDPQSEPEFGEEVTNLYTYGLLPHLKDSLTWRENSGKFFKLINEKIKSDSPMSADETNSFFNEARKYLAIREKLHQVTKEFMYLVEKNAKTKVTAGEASSSQFNSRWTYILNPKDQSGKNLLFGMRISLAAALVLYDNFLSGIKPHYDNPVTRTKLKFDARPEYKNEMEKIVTSFFDVDQRRKLSRAMNLFAIDYNMKAQYKMPIHPMEAELNNIILNSSFYNFMLKEGSVSDPWSERWEQKMNQASDMAKFAGRASTFALSFTFGNIAGSIKAEDRQGYLKNLPPSGLNYLKSKLKPFDVLLEKTPFRMTDKFIPGYYGHVAVYMGTKEQLVAEGLWQHFTEKMKKQIEKGENILEALRFDDRKGFTMEALEGVQLNSLEHFLDIDELLVLRINKELTNEQKHLYARNSVEQYGKPYDFNFDVNTKERIVCSELAYVIFTDIKWPTEKSAGRFTISPDHVMAQSFPGRPFKPVLMYDKNGTRKAEGDKDKMGRVLDLPTELFRNIQSDYATVAYKEESIYRRSLEPQELIHLTSGIAAFQKRLEMIRGATDSIDLEYFIYKNDTDPASRLLTQELIKKANEESKLRPGEKISVRILVDSSATVLKLKDEYASVLRENNIDVRYYNATESAISNFMKANQRNHRKSLIVDGREAITGGRNIGSEYFDLSPTYNFLDTDIYIKGSVAKVMQQSFESYWYSPLSAEPNYIVPRGKLGKKEPEYVKKMQKAYSLVNPNNTDLAFQTTVNSWGPRVLATQMRTICNDSTFVSDMPSDTKHSRRTFETIKQEVAKARKSLDIESPYFVITDVGSEIFRRLLQIPGFKLSVQTNSLHSTDASYTVAAFYPEVSKWTSQGVDMWIYKGEPPSFMEYPKYTKPAVWGIHSKRAVIDGHTTLIGTYNVDPRSSNLNNEMVYICHNNKDLADSTLKDMRDRQFLSVKLGPDGQPVDKSHVFQNASTSKKAQYLLLKKLVTIPALRELL